MNHPLPIRIGDHVGEFGTGEKNPGFGTVLEVNGEWVTIIDWQTRKKIVRNKRTLRTTLRKKEWAW